MKRLFFFKSSASSNGNNKASLPPSTDKQIYWESPSEYGLKGQRREVTQNSPIDFSDAQKQIHSIQKSNKSPALRRSRSMSSTAFSGIESGQTDLSSALHQSRPPCSSVSRQQCDNSFCCRALAPGRHKSKRSEVPTIQSEGSDYAFDSLLQFESSVSSSSSSSIASGNILDRYIDGEQQQERNKPKNDFSEKNFSRTGNSGGQLPPRIRYSSNISPTDSFKDKVRAHSFREAKNSRLRFSSGECVESGFGHESPQRLAKNVIERLSKSHFAQKTSQKEIELDMPVTLEHIYGGSSNRCFSSHPDMVAQKSHSSNDPYETINENHGEDYTYLQKQFFEEYVEGLNLKEPVDDIDVELQRRSKEVEERVIMLSEELAQEKFLQESGFNVHSLFQTIRSLTEEKMSLALEVSSLLKSQIDERTSVKEERAKVELESQKRRLEKEKNELQSALERELDRRSTEWSTKLDKYQSEELRLRERVRELAEKNVSLQRDVTNFNEKETENRSMIMHSEQQLRDLTTRVKDMNEENQDLKKNLCDFQEKYRSAEEDRLCLEKNFAEKEKECKELHKSITRLLRTCSEQERTTDGLREAFSKELENDQSKEKLDKHVAKLQMEQIRLTGVELALRRELESWKVEVDSLRHENISLLNRLKGNGKESDALTMKLDKEMWNRICCLQNQGITMLNESLQLCSNLLRFVKGKGNQFLESKQEKEVMKHGLNEHFLVESEMKAQGLKRGVETLMRSLQMMSVLLHDKSNIVASKHGSRCMDANESIQSNDLAPEDITKYELKAETLLTSLLREKLYSKELEIEQLQAELATAVRGNDILRCEVENAMDNISCVNHKLRNLELQTLKKDDNINRLQDDLHESMKELKIVKSTMEKVSGERDLMWEEVKQYNENNMLLNSEVNMMKKKIENLDEEILLKEGQITILKDTLGSKSFNLLASLDSTGEFLL